MMTHRTFIKLYPAQALDLSKPYQYGFVSTEYGRALVICRAGYLLALGFTDNVEDFIRPSWQSAEWVEDHAAASEIWLSVLNKETIPAVLLGTDFQIQVWNAMLDLNIDELVSYKDLAIRIGHPKAVRAVANAVGANPISVIIPCHRVISSDGSLGGYRWGLEFKKAILSKDR